MRASYPPYRIWTITILTTLTLGAFQGLCQDKRAGLIISPVAENFFVYTTFNYSNGLLFPSNSMYIVTDDGVVMIDTPWDTTQLQPLLDSIWLRHRKRVILSISTHYHADRTAGLDILESHGVQTWSSRQTRELCEKYHENQAMATFEKDTTFVIGNLAIQTFYPGEGHTRDNIVVWFPSTRILYGGCLVKSTETNGLGNIADANLKVWGPTIRRVMKKYDANVVIPGHFGWQDNRALEHTLALLRHHRRGGDNR